MHSHVCCHVHVVFGTADRRGWLEPAVQARLWPYLGGIARANGVAALAIGGTRDHVHMLLSLPASLALAKVVQLLKGNSSKWLHETFPTLKGMEWQQGYGAFSVSVSGLGRTTAYIQAQEEHHRHRPFAEEWAAFLRRHGFTAEPGSPVRDGRK